MPEATGVGRNSEEFESFIARIDSLTDKIIKNQKLFEETLLHGLLSDLEIARLEVVKLEKERKASMQEAARDIKDLKKDFKESEQALIDRLAYVESRLKVLMHSQTRWFVTFIRFICYEKPFDREKELPLIEVKDLIYGTPARVYLLAEGVDPKNLKYGQRLIAPGHGSASHVTEVTDEFSIAGTEATVSEILGNDREGTRIFVSSSQFGDKMLVHPIPSIDMAVLKEGGRVLVDEKARLIIEILPQHESKEYEVETPKVTFDDIGGHRDLIQQITEEIAWPILYPEVDKKLGLPSPRGFCLNGAPGVGKTMIAKAVLNLLAKLLEEKHGKKVEGHFFSIAGPEIQNKYVGETERKMRAIFKKAKERASPTNPVMIFIDEAESLLPTRGSGISSDVEKTNVPQFTALMDGLEDRGNVIVVLATNRVDLMDKAVIRPGRCDMIITVPRPNKEGAREIFAKYLLPEHVHPKYLEKPVYTPRDRDGAPRRTDGGKTKKLKFEGDTGKVASYLIDEAVERMYNEQKKENQFLRVKFVGDKDWTYMRYGDFASGALIENIVERAKKFARRRHLLDEEHEPVGVEKKDLMFAIERAFGEVRAPETFGFHEWLAIEGMSKGKRVEDFKFVPANGTIDEDDD